MPYGKQTLEDSLYFEDGYKQVIGSLTEGRYLTFEYNGYALTNPAPTKDKVTATKTTSKHDSKNQRWVIHGSDGTFQISSALDGRFIGKNGKLVAASEQARSAANFEITFEAGKGYSVQYSGGKYLTIKSNGKVDAEANSAVDYEVYSVSYHN